MSENEIERYLRLRIKGKKHYRLWKKILDILEKDPRPPIKIIFKDPKIESATGLIIGASFGAPGLKGISRADLIVISDSKTLSPHFIALKDIKDIEEIK